MDALGTMTNNYKSILALIGDIYESSINPDHWSVVMEKLAIIMRSKSAVLVIHDSEIRQVNYLHAYGLPKFLLAMLNSPMGTLDPGLKVMRAQPAGKAVNMYRLDEQKMVPRVVHAMLSRFTDLFYFGGINCFNDDNWHAGIGLHRTREEGEFEPEMLELLQDLVPHFQRSLRIQKEFTRLQLLQKNLQLELDRHIIGLILLNEKSEPIYINPMAQRIIERHCSIELQKDILHAYRKDEDEQLQHAIREATITPANQYRGQAIGLSHPDHPMPLALLIVPAAANNPVSWNSGNRPQVAIYLTDPDEPAPIAHDSLMNIYGLTEREAKVAVAIANGYEPSEIADMHSVSVQTVRTQIKSIFNKTHVNRQVDLIRLMLSGPRMSGYVRDTEGILQ